MKGFIINWLLNVIALFLGIVILIAFVALAYWLSTVSIVLMVVFLLISGSLLLTFLEVAE